ncbi:7096_t:CDS:2 [Ambispora gerdemannii]|uniref:7096_t:CDS:1 n=1 Tax=Ambispora gerdemannii TaxID=144530 RepID=A0A9N8YU83_9GLOM|nr:7096_t:CDS:2 [Ambispora gerdemannii]
MVNTRVHRRAVKDENPTEPTKKPTNTKLTTSPSNGSNNKDSKVKGDTQIAALPNDIGDARTTLKAISTAKAVIVSNNPSTKTSTTAVAITSNDVTAEKTNSSSNSLGAGAYIGIGLGILVVIGLAGFLMRKKINRRKDSEKSGDKEWNRSIPSHNQTAAYNKDNTAYTKDNAYSNQAPNSSVDNTPKMTQVRNFNSSTKDDTSNYNVAASGGAAWDYRYGTAENDKKDKPLVASNEKPTQSTFSKQCSDSAPRLPSPKQTDSDATSFYSKARESLQYILNVDDAFSSISLDDNQSSIHRPTSPSQSSQTGSKRVSSPLRPTSPQSFESKANKRASSTLRPTSQSSQVDNKENRKMFLRLSKDIEKNKVADRSSFVEHMEMMLQNFDSNKTTLNTPEFAQNRPDSHPLEDLEEMLAKFASIDPKNKANTQQTNNISDAALPQTPPQTLNPTHNRNSKLIRNTPSPSPINIPEARTYLKKDTVPYSKPSSPPVVNSRLISPPPSVLSMPKKDKTASRELESSFRQSTQTLSSIEGTILKKALTEEPSKISVVDQNKGKNEPKNTEPKILKSPQFNNLNKTLSSSSERNLAVKPKPTESVSPPISPTFLGKKPKKAVGIVNDYVKKFENEAKSAVKTPIPVKRSSIQMSPFIKEATSLSAKRSSIQTTQPGKESTPIPIKRSSIQIPATFNKDVNNKPLGDSPLRGDANSRVSIPKPQNAAKVEEIKANLTGEKKNEEKNEKKSDPKLPAISVTPSNRESTLNEIKDNNKDNDTDSSPKAVRESESELSNIQVAVKVNVARKQTAVASYPAVADSNQDTENNLSAPDTPKFNVTSAEMSDDNDSIYVDPESNTSSARSSLSSTSSSANSAATLVAPTDSAPKDTAPKDTASKDTASKDTASKDTASKDTAPKSYRSPTLSMFGLYDSEDNGSIYRKSQQLESQPVDLEKS